MIEIEIKSDGEPQVLAELIASTLYGHVAPDPESDLAQVGKLVRQQQDEAEERRPSREEIQTVDFARIDPEQDWSDV